MVRVDVITVLAIALLQAGPSTIVAKEVLANPKPIDSSEWMGVAASPDGRVFEVAHQTDEMTAREGAKLECGEATMMMCNVIAVPSSWDIIVVRCTADAGRAPNSFVGGSAQGQALNVATMKVRRDGFDPRNCVKIYSY
jgi:hypothetical protein